MGLGKFWTPSEIEYLKNNYTTKSNHLLSLEMSRTISTIRTTACRLRLRKLRGESLIIKMPPLLGEIRRASQIFGKEGPRYIWQACSDCGKERWVEIHGNTPIHTRCQRCAMKKQAGDKNPFWKGGRLEIWRDKKVSSGPYIIVKINPDNFFYPMAAKSGYVLEHRLIMAQHLGRCLEKWELVHHKDGIKNHNVYSNLQLTTNGSHIVEHSKGYRDGYQQGFYDGQNAKIEELRQEIKLLQWQMNDLKGVVK